MDAINIGLLLPSSSIFPIGKEFEKGLKYGLESLAETGIKVDLVKEFVAGGEIKLTENACRKFFDFDDVDVITGIISNKALGVMAEKFEKQQIPFVINNLGGHVPDVTKLNEYFFINSMSLWQHAYTLGHWGVKTFGKKGMFIGAVYDAGYSFSQMFYEGMHAADSQAEWSFSVPPMPPAGSLTDMSIIFPFLEQYQPDFIFAAFCGDETTLFLNEFIARGWHRKTKVLGLPYLLAPFAPLNDNITIYTTLSFKDAPEISPASAFYYSGLQAGKYIGTVAKEVAGRDQLRDELAKLPGLFNVADNKVSDAEQIAIIEHTIKEGEPEFISKELTLWPTFPIDIELMKPLTAQISAGWFNPYLAI